MTRKITKKSAKKIAAVLAAATAFSASPVLPASLTIQANAAIAEAGGTLLTIPATGPESAAQLLPQCIKRCERIFHGLLPGCLFRLL